MYERQCFGDVNLFRLLNVTVNGAKSTTTKAIEIERIGCVVMTIIESSDTNYPPSVSQCFVPGVKIVDNDNRDGCHLEAICKAYINNQN